MKDHEKDEIRALIELYKDEKIKTDTMVNILNAYLNAMLNSYGKAETIKKELPDKRHYKKRRKKRRLVNSYKAWRKSEENIIKESINSRRVSKIAKRLGRSTTAVHQHISLMKAKGKL